MDPKTLKLQEVFKTMSYGENFEDTSQANEWLQSIEIMDKSNDIDNILKGVKPGIYNPEPSKLVKLAQELEKSVTLIGEIEILSRGVLSKDTRKAVESLAQCFYYYASCVENLTRDIAVGVFEDDHPLWLLGLFLAPALASGHTVVLQAGTKFATVITFIFELATKVGIPKDALVLIPSNEGDLQPYLSTEDVSIVALFVDLLNDKYRGINKLHKKILILSPYKTPMLVFDNADLDSAVNSVVEAAWGYQGMIPWSINTVLIQENIFNKFTAKLKEKVASVRLGNGDDKLADISYPSNRTIFENLIKTVDKAKALGIEIFAKETASSHFTPTLIIGSRVDTNNVLTAPVNDGTVTLLPFRSIDEAVNLANNSRQGLGASVWSENIGLINEVARKLKMSNIWINSHGLFSPNLPIVPLKGSGTGYFGGKQGYTEYKYLEMLSEPLYEALKTSFKKVDAINIAIQSGNSASASWSKTTIFNRIKVFVQIADFIKANEKKLGEKLSKLVLENFKTGIETIVFASQEVGSFSQNGFNVTSLKYPKGCLIIEEKNNEVLLLLAALFEGNAVILLTETPETQEFYQEVSKKLPSRLLTVLPYSLDAAKTASQNKELNGYFAAENNAIFATIPLKESNIFSLVTKGREIEQIFNLVRVYKNVWSNIGQSSQCNL
ncbi:unnamed protein product [Ceutorhynchus assimilis]|uniref:Aldehyde dehydrogenase domain-containing protein n=1 Tax=Ceutorhynchus assimilis TaxID=467358 RepID=A0A9N9MMK2_9CUCU|nr:unnamed protein product [Ceutorhynchus assimilis]